MSQGSPVFLYIDAYDSFANNVIAFLKRLLNAQVETIRIDDSRYLEQNHPDFLNYIRQFDAIIAGPGPGTPENQEDIGLIAQLWTLEEQFRVPVLGICLGFQSLVLSHGGKVDRLKNPRHGVVTQVVHSNRSIFKGLEPLYATQYNSLAVELNDAVKYLDPLAWHRVMAPGPLILSAVCHRDPRKPFWGIQFHPESICTNATSADLVRNWWREASEWNKVHRPNRISRSAAADKTREAAQGDSAIALGAEQITAPSLSIKQIALVDISVSVDMLNSIARSTGSSLLLLESNQQAPGIPINSETGRFTIAGFCDEGTKRILYYAGTSRVEVRNGRDEILDEQSSVDLWAYLKAFMNTVHVGGGDESSPFWGGLVGFVSYEAALQSISVAAGTQHMRPDACFAFVERSIVIDHVENRAWIQSIRPEDDSWLEEMRVATADTPERNGTCSKEDSTSLKMTNVHRPEKDAYIESIQQCKEHIRAGNSYELCLTAEALVSLSAPTSRSSHTWQLYQRLRKSNGAPFAACMRFGPENSQNAVSIISSSPERFLSWNRQGRCQYRPIKGTLRKTPETSFEQAERFFQSSKERAENLMIVDLIRHDLNGVLPSGEAEVTKLMGVEEYATVYQLVSVVEGDLHSKSNSTTGLDVLAASLPPGSMTGAPKKRSCELLHNIEQRRVRGVYSGVLGYLDVGGGGDFSVGIRLAFSWDQDRQDGYDLWRVGAGGAITAQSNDEAEYAEMSTKLEAVLDIFE
ncbi:MAG: para-aminobenzoate synthase, (PABA) [Bathelium mastoideum]|nr:MAG: para-aminobenzoate synthase, (PABA) [Bathelium mastoideum]KAI9685519.1 MAG: para-aminobenzoate synthase, (PABA) [Bathelium mastoideum]